MSIINYPIENVILAALMDITAHIPRDMRILVVDDDAPMRRIVKTTLRQLGFKNILEAEDGQIALDRLKKEEVQLIISDWNMPNMPGIDLLRTVRASEKWKNVPFIMVTSEGKKENVMEALNAGVSNYVVKPFTTEVMEEKLSEIFKK